MATLVKATAGILAVLGFVILGLRLAFPLPSLEGRTESTAIAAANTTPLGRSVLAVSAGHPGLTGVRPLQDGREAFAARVLLVRAAQASIDVQYYIWQKDATGLMLLDELRVAAQRGVRVRLLLDDNGTGGLDDELSALDALPNVEVRLFNPFTLRRPKALSYLFDFPRLNRRMHNKSLTVDGIATIVGGRNIGDIYFAYGLNEHYIDSDVLAAGPAAADVARDFDAYWASQSAYPAGRILAPSQDGLTRLQSQAGMAARSEGASAYQRAIRDTALIASLAEGTLDLDWRPVTLFSDDPAKGVGKAADGDKLAGRIAALMESPKRRLDAVSAYFVPGKQGTALLASLAQRGVAVRVVTNALESTDVFLVHAGYVRYRRDLLAAGVQLYELRAGTARQDGNVETAGGSGGSGTSGSSRTSLHAKTYGLDEERTFISSFNFDPRSANLNTEMGLLIESPPLAARMSSELERHLAANAYRLRLSPDGNLLWEGRDAQGRIFVSDAEPGTSLPRRLAMRVLGWLPIEWLL